MIEIVNSTPQNAARKYGRIKRYTLRVNEWNPTHKCWHNGRGTMNCRTFAEAKERALQFVERYQSSENEVIISIQSDAYLTNDWWEEREGEELLIEYTNQPIHTVLLRHFIYEHNWKKLLKYFTDININVKEVKRTHDLMDIHIDINGKDSIIVKRGRKPLYQITRELGLISDLKDGIIHA